jgi:hypothetical protein
MAGLGGGAACPPAPAAPSFDGAPYALRPKLNRAATWISACRWSEAEAELAFADRERAKQSPGEAAAWIHWILVARDYKAQMMSLQAGYTPDPEGGKVGGGSTVPIQSTPLPSHLYPDASPQQSAADKFLDWIGWDQSGGTAPAPSAPAPSARQALQAELAATPPGSVSAQRAELAAKLAQAQAAQRELEAAQAQAAEAQRQQAAAAAAGAAAAQEAERARWLAKVQAAQRAGVKPPPRPPMPRAVIPPMLIPPPPPPPMTAPQAGVPRWVWAALALGALSAGAFWIIRRRS